MLLIDPRQGSGDLAYLFSAHGVPYAVMPADNPLPYADFAFCGNGPDGDVMVGIERKRPSELVGELRGGGRSAKRLVGSQLPGLLESFEYPYLLVEGIWSCSDRGELVTRNGGGWMPVYAGNKSMMYSELSGFLDSLELRAVSKSGEPLRVKRTGSPKESVAWMVQLYKGFMKGWTQHHAHEGVYAPSGGQEVRRKGQFVRREVSVAEKMWHQVPGLDRMAKFIAQKYGEPFPGITVEGLAGIVIEVDGKDGKKKQRLGKVRAEKIVGLIRRNGNGK